MQKQENKPVTVVSEGLVFVGVRTRFAFVWVEAGVAPVKSVKASSVLLDTVHKFLLGTNLSKHDKSRCRRQAAEMSLNEIQCLVVHLRGFRRNSARP